MFFNNLNDLKDYYKFCFSNNKKLNGLNLNLKPLKINEFINQLRFLYPLNFPDLSDLPFLFNLAKLNIPNSEKREFISSLHSLLKNRRNFLYRYKLDNKTLLESAKILIDDINDGNKSTDNKHQNKSKNNKLNSLTQSSINLVNRSCCVIFKNVPANISIKNICDFFWDLNWFSDKSRRIRPIFTDKTTNFTTYILVFNDNESANICINRANNNHLFFNEVFPIVHAEIL